MGGKFDRTISSASLSVAPGVGFEKAVADLQRMFGGDSTVEHDVELEDRLGHRRQYDVVIRGKLAGHDVLGVIECKDEKRKIGPEIVEAFVTKSDAVRANFRALVARSGFTPKALDICRHH